MQTPRTSSPPLTILSQNFVWPIIPNPGVQHTKAVDKVDADFELSDIIMSPLDFYKLKLKWEMFCILIFEIVFRRVNSGSGSFDEEVLREWDDDLTYLRSKSSEESCQNLT